MSTSPGAPTWLNGEMTASEPANRVRGGDVSPSSFTTIAQPRAHDFVVEQIRREIALGIIAPGSALPPERELMKVFGVGRVTIQLAIGQLESEHVIETRRGRSGGSFVKAPDADAHALDYRVVELRRHADRLLQVLEYREVLEPAATAITARKMTRQQSSQLQKLVDRTTDASDDAEFMRWDTAFHLLIAKATANQFMIDALEQIRVELNPALQLLPDTRVWHELSNHEHQEIVTALSAKDSEAAESLMAGHIAHADKSIRTLLKSLSRR
jgi:GntR family transcriptional regulator, transcriptional repressor for pyruvate dehydrogenase complex